MVYKDGDIRVDTEFTVMKTDMQEILRTKNFSDYYGEILEIERNNKKSENENNIVHFSKRSWSACLSKSFRQNASDR